MCFSCEFFTGSKEKKISEFKAFGGEHFRLSEHLPSSATIIIRTADAPSRTIASLRRFYGIVSLCCPFAREILAGQKKEKLISIIKFF